MDLPLALQDVWGSRPNRNKPIRFPESAFKESLIASGEKVNWLANPVLDWGGHILKDEERTEAFNEACRYVSKVENYQVEPAPEKLAMAMKLMEERFLGGDARNGFVSHPHWDENNKASVIRALRAADDELDLWMNICNGTPPATVEYPRPGIGEVAGGTLLDALKTRTDENGLLFPLCPGRFVDLEKLPHLLIAGTTGSGKSAFIESMLVSLALTHGPDEVKFLLFDPKQVELSRFAGLPHVYFTAFMGDDEGAATDPELMVPSLEEIEEVMRERLAKMRAVPARDLKELEKKTGEGFSASSW